MLVMCIIVPVGVITNLVRREGEGEGERERGRERERWGGAGSYMLVVCYSSCR